MELEVGSRCIFWNVSELHGAIVSFLFFFLSPRLLDFLLVLFREGLYNCARCAHGALHGAAHQTDRASDWLGYKSDQALANADGCALGTLCFGSLVGLGYDSRHAVEDTFQECKAAVSETACNILRVLVVLRVLRNRGPGEVGRSVGDRHRNAVQALAFAKRIFLLLFAGIDRGLLQIVVVSLLAAVGAHLECLYHELDLLGLLGQHHHFFALFLSFLHELELKARQGLSCLLVDDLSL